MDASNGEKQSGHAKASRSRVTLRVLGSWPSSCRCSFMAAGAFRSVLGFFVVEFSFSFVALAPLLFSIFLRLPDGKSGTTLLVWAFYRRELKECGRRRKEERSWWGRPPLD